MTMMMMTQYESNKNITISFINLNLTNDTLVSPFFNRCLSSWWTTEAHQTDHFGHTGLAGVQMAIDEPGDSFNYEASTVST